MVKATPPDNQLNYTISQGDMRGYNGQTIKPLTIRAILDHVATRQRSDAAVSDSERAFLTAFVAAGDRGAFIEENFLQDAIAGGKTRRKKSYESDSGPDEEPPQGWVGLHRFLGLYVINVTQYGEGQDDFGPFAKRKDANEAFDWAVLFYIP